MTTALPLILTALLLLPLWAMDRDWEGVRVAAWFFAAGVVMAVVGRVFYG